ncbi:hypothetical protein BH11MYX4_BH11MYX4_01820 [soil metagenome]
MKLTTPFYVDDDTLAELRDYAKRRNIKLSTAISYAVRSGLLRLNALRAYRSTPKGRRARRLAADRAAERKRR